MTDARGTLARRHNISNQRVDEIWREHYGGHTLKDARGGLKKKPAAPPQTAPKHSGKNEIEVLPDGSKILKTTRGTYTLAPPKPAAKDAPRTAAIAEKVKEQTQAPELDLEVVGGAADDETARLVAGQVLAGNNNPELLAVLDRIVDLNENISRATEMLCRQAQGRAKRERSGAQYERKRIAAGVTKARIGQNYAANSISDDLGQSGYDDASEDTSEQSVPNYDDDSGSAEESDGGFDSVDDGESSGEGFDDRANYVLAGQRGRVREEATRFVDRDGGVLETAAGRSRGAKPVYSAVARKPGRATKQTDTNPTNRAGARFSAPQRDAGKGPVQQDSGNSVGKFGERPGAWTFDNRPSPQRPSGDEWRARLKRPP